MEFIIHVIPYNYVCICVRKPMVSAATGVSINWRKVVNSM